MAKKEKEETTEKKVELVSVEMTPEQRDKVVKILSEEKKEPSIKEDDSEYELSLNYAHKINGVSYGPGKVVVKANLSSILMNQDAEQRRQEIGLNVSADRLYKIMQGGGSVRVK